MDFIALDLETANRNRDSICAIGMAKVKGNAVIDTYYQLINPECEFDGFNTYIHGIDADMVADEPTFEKVYETISRFKGDLPLVAHSTQFDMYALQDCMAKYNLAYWDNPYVCTRRISMELLPKFGSYRLNDVISELGLTPFDHHHALADAKASAELLVHFNDTGQLPSMDDFVEAYRFKYGRIGHNGFVKKDCSKKITVDTSNIEADVNHPLYDKHLCFTGALEKYTRAEIAQVVTDIGAHFDSGIKRSTDYLVVGNLENMEKQYGYKESSKIKKVKANAEKGLPIEILSEMDFYQRMEGGM